MAIDTSAAGVDPAALPHSSRWDSLRIVEFGPRHIPEAARMHLASYRRAMASNPALPAGPLDPRPVESLLRRAAAAGPAVAAIRDGELEGSVAGFPVPRLRGSGTGVHSPEWAHGVRDGAAGIYETLYSAISARWARAGQLCHCVSVMTGNPDLEESLSWSGFGLMVADAIRTPAAALAAGAAGADR
jgi:hypothetical protein